jgi:hypothetical protein
MAVWRLIQSWWRARHRQIDLEILWPLCRDGATDLDYAKAAFAVHAFNDPAWLELGEAEIFDLIDGLKPRPTLLGPQGQARSEK